MFRVLMLCLAFIASSAFAENKVEKAGGLYLVKSIKHENDFFVTTFESVAKTGRFDTLRLESDHVHFAVKEGDKVRLSAEIIKEKANVAEVGQLLIFVPHVEGYAPIWLISRNGTLDDLRATDYLKMHAPQSDFRIL